MKQIILVHRWDGSPEADWYPWLQQELAKRQITLKILKMPNPSVPEIKAWVKTLEREVKTLNTKTYFIGHSIGCQTILRFLEKKNKEIGGAVFVAGWFTLNLETEEEKQIAKPWLETLIDFKKVKIKKCIAIFSEDDPFVPQEANSQRFKEELNAKIIIEKGKGHYNETQDQTILKEILKILT